MLCRSRLHFSVKCFLQNIHSKSSRCLSCICIWRFRSLEVANPISHPGCEHFSGFVRFRRSRLVSPIGFLPLRSLFRLPLPRTLFGGIGSRGVGDWLCEEGVFNSIPWSLSPSIPSGLRDMQLTTFNGDESIDGLDHVPGEPLAPTTIPILPGFVPGDSEMKYSDSSLLEKEPTCSFRGNPALQAVAAPISSKHGPSCPSKPSLCPNISPRSRLGDVITPAPEGSSFGVIPRLHELSRISRHGQKPGVRKYS